ISPKKPVSSDIITGLGISAVDENNFIALPKVYTQESMPVDTSSIPTNDDLSRFPYIREVNILTIKANLELLIDSNVPQTSKHAHTLTNTHLHKYTHKPPHTPTCKHTHIHTLTHTYTQTHVHSEIKLHTHTHTL